MDETYKTLLHWHRRLNSYGWKEHLCFSFLFHILNYFSTVPSPSLSFSLGILPPSYLTPLQSHLLHLISPPHVSLSHHYFGFMSWMSSFSFMQPSTIWKVKSNSHKRSLPPSLPPSVSSLGWAEGRSHQQSIRAQWQELCGSDRVQCAVLKAVGVQHREAATGRHPRRTNNAALSTPAGDWILRPCGLCWWSDVLYCSMSHFIGTLKLESKTSVNNTFVFILPGCSLTFSLCTNNNNKVKLIHKNYPPSSSHLSICEMRDSNWIRRWKEWEDLLLKQTSNWILQRG